MLEGLGDLGVRACGSVASQRWRIVLIVAIGLGVAAPAARGATTKSPPASPVPVRISFSAHGGGEYRDVFRLLTDVGRECYARKTEDETLALSWNLGWNGTIVRVGSSYRLRVDARAQQAISGAVTGTSVRDACDEEDEADPQWVGSDSCDHQLQPTSRGAIESMGGQTARTTIVLEGPRFGTPPAPCELDIRNDQLAAHVPIDLAAVARRPVGKALTMPVGTNHPRRGDSFLAVRTCTDVPHTYDGWVWLYDCTDELTWEGTLSITRR